MALLLLLSLALCPSMAMAHMNNLFGGLGLCGPPPPMCPPPCPILPPPLPCPPPLPPCPPCMPTFCPPPILCPPPPPPCPLPPPPCPPLPPPCTCPASAGYAIGPPMGGYPMASYAQSSYYPTNDCCCGCASPCRFMAARAKTHGARIFAAPTEQQEGEDQDPTCNSEKLREVISQHISDDPSESKRAIQKAAEEKLFSKINVICANGDFSYVAYTDAYCQASSGKVTCYAFRPLGPGPSSEEANHNS